MPRLSGEREQKGLSTLDFVVPYSSPGNHSGSPRKTILLAEDEEFIRKAISEALELAGYQVIIAASGFEARQAYWSHPGTVDLLLTDVVMPGVNGRELAEELVGACPELRVLLMTGYSGEFAAHELSINQLRWIAKPFSVSALLATVHSALQNQTITPLGDTEPVCNISWPA